MSTENPNIPTDAEYEEAMRREDQGVRTTFHTYAAAGVIAVRGPRKRRDTYTDDEREILETSEPLDTIDGDPNLTTDQLIANTKSAHFAAARTPGAATGSKRTPRRKQAREVQPGDGEAIFSEDSGQPDWRWRTGTEFAPGQSERDHAAAAAAMEHWRPTKEPDHREII